MKLGELHVSIFFSSRFSQHSYLDEVRAMKTRVVKLNILIAEPYEVIRFGLHTIFAGDPRVLNVYEVTNKEDLYDYMLTFPLDLIVINQSLVKDVSLLETKNFVVLAAKPDLAVLKSVYDYGALGYLSLNVSAALLCTLLDASKKSFLIEPTLGPWIMNTVCQCTQSPCRRLSLD